jgi:hypothetical protein
MGAQESRAAAGVPYRSPHSFTFGPRGSEWRADRQQLWMQVPVPYSYDPPSLSQLARADLWLHRWTGIADALVEFSGTKEGRARLNELDTKLHLCSRAVNSESERAAIAFVREQLIVHDNRATVATRGIFRPNRVEGVLHVPRLDQRIFTSQTLPQNPSMLELADLWLHRWTVIADELLHCSQTSGMDAQRLHLQSELVNEANQFRVIQYIEQQLRLHPDEISPPPVSQVSSPQPAAAENEREKLMEAWAPPEHKWLMDPTLPPRILNYDRSGRPRPFNAIVDTARSYIRAHDFNRMQNQHRLKSDTPMPPANDPFGLDQLPPHWQRR